MVQPLHACHSFREELLARILGFWENTRGLPNQNFYFTQQTGVPIQLSILRRGWSLVTLTLSFCMRHWCQYRCLVPNLHFNRCWYARLSMTSRNCCQTQLLTTCMGPPCPSYLRSVQMTGRILSPPGNVLMKLFRSGFAQTSSSHG